jgi:hypothetical protein
MTKLAIVLNVYRRVEHICNLISHGKHGYITWEPEKKYLVWGRLRAQQNIPRARRAAGWPGHPPPPLCVIIRLHSQLSTATSVATPNQAVRAYHARERHEATGRPSQQQQHCRPPVPKQPGHDWPTNPRDNQMSTFPDYCKQHIKQSTNIKISRWPLFTGNNFVSEGSL